MIFQKDAIYGQAYKAVVQASPGHQVPHHLLAAAASYHGATVYQRFCDENGKPPYEDAKRIIGEAVNSFVEEHVKSKGLHWIDRRRAKWHGRHQAERALVDQGEYPNQ